MHRLMPTDERWLQLSSILRSHCIYDKRELRLTLEGIYYRLRNSNIWRDLPRNR